MANQVALSGLVGNRVYAFPDFWRGQREISCDETFPLRSGRSGRADGRTPAEIDIMEFFAGCSSRTSPGDRISNGREVGSVSPQKFAHRQEPVSRAAVPAQPCDWRREWLDSSLTEFSGGFEVDYVRTRCGQRRAAVHRHGVQRGQHAPRSLEAEAASRSGCH